MSKLTNKDNLKKLAQALDNRSKALVKSSIAEESARAQGIEADLQEQIEKTQDMFGGKSIRYITQADYNQLTDEQKNDPTVIYFITDAEDLSHAHANKELLDKFGSRTLTVGNKGKTFDGSANVSWTLAEIGAAPSSHNHDDRYYTESEINTKVTSLQAEIDADVKVETDRAKAAENALQAAIDGKADSVHSHDDRYFTESEINKIVADLQAEIDTDVEVEKNRAENAEIYIQTLLEGKAPSVHSHDDAYYTKSAIDTKVADLQDEIDADVKVVADELTDVNTTLTGYIGEAFGVLDEHQKRLNNHNAIIENHTSRINTIQGDGVGSIKYTVNEAVKVEEERAKAAEVALQANIDKKADISHGNHVPATQTASNKVFLRNDNTWATITPANIGAAASSHAHDDKYYTETEIDAKIATLNNAINDKASAVHNHDNLYYTESEVDTIVADLQAEIDADVKAEADRAKGVENSLQSAINGKAPISHSHGDLYYTEDEIDDKVADLQAEIDADVLTETNRAKGVENALDAAIKTKADSGHTHDGRYYTESEINTKVADLQAEIDADVLVETNRAKGVEASLQSAINGKAPNGHLHDDRYYTETEVDEIVEEIQGDIADAVEVEAIRAKAAESTLQANIDKKANTGHTHDDRYFTETEINNKLAGYSATGHNHDDKYYTETEIDAKVTTLQSNIDGKANKSHGNHVPTVETANNARFLRNDNTWQTITPSNIGAAASSHGTHVTYASAVPLANGTAAIGSSGKVAREDHVHPLQTEVSGNAGSADVLSTPRNITIGNQTNAFDGSENITYTLSAIGASAEGHNHDGRYYTESEINTKVSSLQSEIDADVKVETDRAKAAENALQANIDKKSDSGHTHTNFAIKLNGGTTEGTNLFTYNGGTAKTVNITPSGIGASATGHTHDDRYFTETEIDAKITTINNSIATAKSDAQKYADNKIAALVGSAPESLNTLQELSKAITDHEDVYEAYVVEMDSKLAGKSDTGHTHNYAGSSSAGGAATSANKVNQNLVVKLNGGATEGTNLFTFNGSAAKTINITPSGIGAANSSHGTHVTYSTTTPKANGTASVGSSSDVARADHIHPLQTTISGNAGSADKLSTARTITIGNKSNTFDGTANITYTLAEIGAAESEHNHDSAYSKTGHTHNYAGSSSAGGVATSAAKLATPVTLTIGAKGKTFDGSGNQSWSLSEMGAAASGHKHGLLHDNLTCTVENTETDNGWSMINSSYGGFLLKSIRTNASTPNWICNNYSAGIAFGGADTKGVLSMAYSTPSIKFAGGNGTKPVWWIGLTGATGTNYNLANFENKNHGIHVTYATTAPKANGTAAIGTSSRIAREDHVHPLQATISGNAATSSKWQTARTLTIGNAGKSVDGSENVSWSLTEIGAMPLTTTSETLDLDNSKTTGVYNLKSSSCTNAPASGNATLFVNFDVGTPYQIFMHDTTFKLYYRSYNTTNSTWNSWTSTLGNDISGNAGTATKLSSARTINGTNFDGSGNITTANWGTARNISISDSDGANTGTAVSVNGSGNATLKLPVTIKASLTGNASTATKLAGTKTINGTAFDGSSNITTANWGTSRNLQIGNSSKAVNGSAGVSWSLAEIGASPLQKSVVSRTVSNGTLTLSTDRYQYAKLANGNTIALPSVSNFTEINLFVKDCNISTIKLPDKCKWRVDPNLNSGTSFMFKFIYTTQEWLAEVNIYS